MATLKYNNKKTIVDGISFMSQQEALRYLALKDMKAKGEIKDFTIMAAGGS